MDITTKIFLAAEAHGRKVGGRVDFSMVSLGLATPGGAASVSGGVAWDHLHQGAPARGESENRKNKQN